MTMTEQFDIVDAQDNPTGRLTAKREAHLNGTLHRCVAVFVFDAQGRLYVQRHKKSDLLDHSVGGHVSAGEDYAASAQREAAEELGLAGQKLLPVATGIYSNETLYDNQGGWDMKHMFAIFECRPGAGWQFRPNDEVEEIYPEHIETIVQQMNANPGEFTPGFINMLAEYLRIKRLPQQLDLAACRANWAATTAYQHNRVTK